MRATEQQVQQTPQMTMWLSRASAGLSVFVLALVFVLNDLWLGVAAVLAGGALWLLGHVRPLGPQRPLSRPGALASSAALVVLVAAAGAQVLLTVGGGWPVLGLAAALVSVDLDQFAQMMRAVGLDDCAAELERRHIRRLLVVAAIGSVLGWVVFGVCLRLCFVLGLIVAGRALLGLGLTIGYLRRVRD